VSRTSTASSSPSELRSGERLPEVPVTPRDVERRLLELGVRPSRELGQSFLTDPFVADVEAALVDVPRGTPVMEVGGGLGVLTVALLRRGLYPLTVVERDARLASHLRKTFGARIQVVTRDARDGPWPHDGVVVGNLPFSVATPILLDLFARRGLRVVALVQREVAERLAASEGSKTYGRPSIMAALYGRVELFQVVARRAFTPTPAVDGRILRFDPREGPLPVDDPARFTRLLAALFSHRRKQLGNLLPMVVPSGADPAEVAHAAQWPEGWARMRPEDLPPEAYFRMAHALSAPR
jgi:16S rRNA (adenine1518-N6/adenine1519-N6)-dimethyltransferase